MTINWSNFKSVIFFIFKKILKNQKPKNFIIYNIQNFTIQISFFFKKLFMQGFIF